MGNSGEELAPTNEEGIVLSGALLMFILLVIISLWVGALGFIAMVLTGYSVLVRRRLAWWLAFASLVAMCLISLACMIFDGLDLCFFSLLGYFCISLLHLRTDIRVIHQVYL